MYLASLAEADDPSEYESVTVDGREFYCRREVAEPRAAKRRYSDQFKDPLFKLRDQYRKLKMLRQFMARHDLDELTEKYKAAILECATILNKENDVGMPAIYSHFNLDRFELDPEDFGVCADDLQDE